MNPLVKPFLAAALLLAASVRAEFIRVDGHWQVKPGTACDIAGEADRTIVLLAMDKASAEAEAGNLGAALSAWEVIAESRRDSEAEAVALLNQARIRAARGEFDTATKLIEELYARHSSFSNFQEAVQVQYEIGERIESGQRTRLGGWFPWFSDREAALKAWAKAVTYAPNGPLADLCLIRSARLALELDREPKANEVLEQLVSDYPTSKHLPEALEKLAYLRAKESLGPDWDQSSTIEAADHWRTLADQFPNDPRAKEAIAKIGELRDKAARGRLNLAKFYWFSRNNPEAAKLMANSCRSLAPESAAAKEAESLLAEIAKNPTPPKTLADRLLGTYPRPRMANETTKPAPVGEDLDSLGFKKEVPRSATETERR